ncbi:hypothetical protein [Pseudomonas weihenstephanensis]|uniref:hypothetical protein n=1 Tax=Pseudomonas TaxID=286 RepID=UPI00193C6DDD|nr:hypothetical protein [Pseudomonas weihenstephanensis]MBM1191554.1 helix-turn-helix domain-containing protein [Pseudomonas weihenstephanensis]
MSALKESITKVGGVAKASAICGVSQRAIYKWIAAESLPRTEYSGETRYAHLLAAASGEFAAEWLLAKAMPGQAMKLAS